MEQNKKHEQEMLEQMLKYASVQSLEALYDEYADDTLDDSQPSEQLNNAVEQMLSEARAKEQAAERAQKKAARRKHMLRRIAAALVLVAAIGAVGGMLVMNVEAWRVPFLNFVMEITGEEISFYIENPNIASEEVRIPEDMKLPVYIPDGFKVSEGGADESQKYVIYRNETDGRIVLVCYVMEEIKWEKHADNALENIKINGMDAYAI